LSVCLLIMFDTLFLRPTRHCNTSPHFTQLHFTTLHPTTLHYTYRHFTSSHLLFGARQKRRQILCEVWRSQCGARDDCCIMGCNLVNMVSVATFQRNVLSETLPWTLEPCDKFGNWMIRVFLQVRRVPFVSYCSLPFFVRSRGSSASVVIRTTGSSSPSVVDITCPPRPRYRRLCDLLTTHPEGVGAKLRGLAAVPPFPHTSTRRGAQLCAGVAYVSVWECGCKMQIPLRCVAQRNVLCVGTDSK
jgi:hypothetical protein